MAPVSFSEQGSHPGSGPGRTRSGPSIPPPPLGRNKVGRYEVIYPLAVGGMASVHVGRLSGMAGFEKLVAIKTIHPHLAVQSEFVRMFLDEARVAARIHHPNVGEILEIGEEDGLLFMAGELIRGQDLRDVFRRAGRSGVAVSHGMCAYICSQVCMALHAAHSLTDPEVGPLHIVHRDVSPRNVLVTYDGFVKLIDFGVASARGKLSQTEADGLKGKIGFMSPEQLRGHGVDRRSDLFALGVMLYQMVTGAHPFPGDNDGARVERVLHGPIVPPRQVNPRTRPEMEAIILKAMARDRTERYRDAAVMGRDLEEYVRRSGERTGSGALAELMTGLFADKIADHEIRLRNFRKTAGDATGLQSLPSGLAGVPLAALDDGGDTGPGTPSALRRWAVTNPKAPLRSGLDRRLVLAGGGALALILGLVVAVLVLVAGGGSGDGAPGGPASPAGPAAAAVGTAPGAGAVPAAPPEPVRLEEDVVAAAPPASAAPPAEVTVTFRVDPPGARILLDGREVALEGGALELPADGASHEVEVAADGYRPRTERVTADRDREIEIALERLPPAAGPAMTGGDPAVEKKPADEAPPKPAAPKPAKGKKGKGSGLMDSPYS
jgi:serine/threonine-protein kinase